MFVRSVLRGRHKIALCAALLGTTSCARPELPQITAQAPVDATEHPGTEDAATKDAGEDVRRDAASPSVIDVKDAAPANVIDAGRVDSAVIDAGSEPVRDAAPAMPEPPVMVTPESELCALAGYDVAILGDSFIRLTGDFTRILQNKARAAGALGPNETYVDVSKPLASMNRTPGIPAQYPEATAETKRRGGTVPKLVIMTGGGQDVLIDNRPCLNPSSADEVANTPECVAVVDEVLSTAQSLIDNAVAAGTKAAIYFFYPNLPRASLAGGANGNSVIDYAAPRAKQLCEGQTAAPCYFIDLRPGFADPNNPGYPRPGLIGFDGVSPTEAGSQIVASEVWKVMQDHCLASER